jgi:rhodanese-related sulfurtransferase
MGETPTVPDRSIPRPPGNRRLVPDASAPIDVPPPAEPDLRSVKFVLDNILFIAAAAISGFMLLWPKLGRGSGDSAVSPLEATQLINHRNAIIVDLRDEKAYAAGSLAGARHAPFAELKAKVAELVRFKARPVVILCQTGQQSARAVTAFKEGGFEEAYALAGGLEAWQKAGLPLVSPRDTKQLPKAGPRADTPRKGKSDNRSKAALAVTTAAVPASADGESANDAANPTDAGPVDEATTDTPPSVKAV